MRIGSWPIALFLVVLASALIPAGLAAQDNRTRAGPPPDAVEVLSISHPESVPLITEDILEITVRVQVPNIRVRGGEFAVVLAAKRAGSSTGLVLPTSSSAGAQVLTARGTVDLSVRVGELVALGAETDPLLVWPLLARRDPDYEPPYGDGPPGLEPRALGQSFAWTVVP